MSKKKNNGKNKRFTASHVMLYVILGIYIAVVVVGIVMLKFCADMDDMESAKVVFTALASMTTICGSATVGFYATKASRENVLQISNSKYRMRLDLAKDIYKEVQGSKLDEKSLQFMRTLITDDNVAVDNINIPSTSGGVDINASCPVNTEGMG